ncbi:hypothetical protein RHMOL_Rhmol09G0178600 [Rhododendron molle]|uniref:Uncharacterized protein n=1 Tax=Rhododendron molle TaxID=49168 RepID=A0ACC0MED3_RHOML|nr:hypothetical protein RHMOL_Rhmol09G0178600 [Rhododendron molle]
MGSLCSCFRVREVEENVESDNGNCIWSSCFSHYFKTKLIGLSSVSLLLYFVIFGRTKSPTFEVRSNGCTLYYYSILTVHLQYGALFGRVEEHAAPSHLPNSPNINPRISSMPGSSDGATSQELESSKKIPGKVLMAGKVRVNPEEEDDCPICLEEFIPDNPKITTECHHNYHLQCIFEWQKRSEKCPICVQVMVCEGLT